MFYSKRILAVALCLLVANGIVSAAGITAVGPASGPLGFPQWIQDSTGLQLELCTDATGFCSPPADGEGFYWTAVADAPPLTTAGRTQLVLAWEAAYGGAGDAVNGQQIIFGRIRVRVDVAVGGTYTITHPYGQITFDNVTVADGINYTQDVGGIDIVNVEAGYQGILAASGPALVWPDYLTNPATLLGQYVGDNATPHVVTGSPTGNNLFRVEGPGGIDVSTDLFTVMGKVFTGAAPTPWTFPDPPPQLLAAVGPVNRAAPFNPGSLAEVTGILIPGYPLGFPIWYQDTVADGLQLTICPGTDPQCISVPPDPLDPESVAIGMGEEAFYWSAESTAVGGGIDGLLVLALEAAFGGDGSPHDGEQMVFTRLRIRIDAPVAGTYTITHPFGTKTFTDVPAGRRTVNFTEDLGGASPLDPDSAMAGALYGNLSKFLTWPDFLADPTLIALNIASGNTYIGSPLVAHTVTGSPTGNNLFRIEGPGGRVAETDLFFVSGKLFDVGTFTPDVPVIASVTATPAAILDSQTSQLLVLASDNGLPSPLTYNWIVPAGTGSVDNAAIANPVYTPPAVAADQIFTLTVEVSDGLNTVSGTVDVTVSPTLTAPVISSVTATPVLILDNQTSQLNVVATDTDGLPSPLTYNWIVPAGAGSVDNAAIANPVYTPPAAAATQTFTLTVEVSDGLNTVSGTVDITVTPFILPVALSPVAVDDAAAVNLNTATVINVLANDSPISGTLNPASVTIASLPANGTIAVNPATGAVTYTPANNYTGPDSFAYTVENSLGGISNIATVSITVTGPATLTTITVTRAEYRARRAQWVITGTTTVSQDTLVFRVGPDFTGDVIGIRAAGRANRLGIAKFSLSIVNRAAPPDGTNTISIQSSDGTLLLGVPVTVK